MDPPWRGCARGHFGHTRQNSSKNRRGAHEWRISGSIYEALGSSTNVAIGGTSGPRAGLRLALKGNEDVTMAQGEEETYLVRTVKD